jgi:hypothetical protein
MVRFAGVSRHQHWHRRHFCRSKAVFVGIIGMFISSGRFFGFLPGILIVLLFVAPSLFGVPAIQLYLKKKWRNTDWPGTKVSWRRTVAAYILVAVSSNFAYLVLALGYASLANIL